MRGTSRPGWVIGVSVFVVVWSTLNGLTGVWHATDDYPTPWTEHLTAVLLTVAGFGIVWMIWRPRRLPEPDPRGKAVARPSWWLRLGGLFAAVIGGAVAMNAWELARAGHPSFDGIGRVLVVAVLGLVGLVLLLAAWGAWWTRQTIDPHEATSRVFLGTSRIAKEHATAVQVTAFTVHAGRAGGKIPVDRILVEGSNQRGAPARAAFDATMTNEEQALAVLDLWVRERPALVHDEDTWALFEARGALPRTP